LPARFVTDFARPPALLVAFFAMDDLLFLGFD
jgi:hypothetical protein